MGRQKNLNKYSHPPPPPKKTKKLIYTDMECQITFCVDCTHYHQALTFLANQYLES